MSPEIGSEVYFIVGRQVAKGILIRLDLAENGAYISCIISNGKRRAFIKRPIYATREECVADLKQLDMFHGVFK